jgi:Family of unknown function (DUF5752)
LKAAEQPFYFMTASYVTCVTDIKVSNLAGLAEGLKTCSDTSIFHHTFQSLRRHHFLTEGFSNDFAQWTLASCNQAELAEELAALDIREYLNLADLRSDLLRIVDEFRNTHSDLAGVKAFEPFYFCDSLEVTVPLGVEVRTLEEFRKGVERLGHASFHYHFLASRLRLHLRTNDFSLWLDTALGLSNLARRVNRIDVYTNTLESSKENLLALVDQELNG